MPLLERLRFPVHREQQSRRVFEIRVAGLREQLRSKTPAPGMTIPEMRVVVNRIGEEAQTLVAEKYRHLE